MLDRFWKDRRRAQAGTTLVELLVSVAIIGLALVLIVGTFSTGLLDATLTKRNTAAQAVIQYEMAKIQGSQFGTLPTSFSECFATESATDPVQVASGGSCSGGPFTLRADVTMTSSVGSQQRWKITL